MDYIPTIERVEAARSAPSHNHEQTPTPDQDQIATFATWAAAWAFGEARFKGHRVGFHYDERADLYTVTLAPARPPASPLPDLPEAHRQTFPSYAQAWAYGRAFVGRYRFSTWRDPITERYAVTDPGWVEERLAKFRREAVTT